MSNLRKRPEIHTSQLVSNETKFLANNALRAEVYAIGYGLAAKYLIEKGLSYRSETTLEKAAKVSILALGGATAAAAVCKTITAIDFGIELCDEKQAIKEEMLFRSLSNKL